MKKLKKLLEKGNELLIKNEICKDQKGGPGIEELGLLLFIGLVVVSKGDSTGSTVGSVFDKVITGIKTGFGISS